MQAWQIYRNDDRPSINFQVIDDVNDVPVNLSLSTTIVYAKFRQKGTTTVLQTITCTKLGTGATGWVNLAWPTDALDDLSRGRYEIEVCVDFDGSIETVGRYYWDGSAYDDAKTMPVNLREDF